MNDHRHTPRKRATQTIEVTDTISERVIGHVGNLSEEGMLLISPRALPPNALFQFSFNLPLTPGADARGGAARRNEPQRIEIGVHEQWAEPGGVAGQYWTGFRIIDIGAEDQRRLSQWLATAT
jgi:hypothetical protein